MRCAMIRNLFWKECREARWLLYVGLAIFVAIPLVMDVMMIGRWTGWWERKGVESYGISSGVLSIFQLLGGFFAVILAVAMVCRDVRDDGPPEPWRLLPARTSEFTFVKYFSGFFVLCFVGLTVILLDCLVVEAIGTIRDRHEMRRIYDWQTLNHIGKGITFLSAMLVTYSMTFMLACWLKRTIPTVLLSITLIVLLYTLPLFIPAMESLSLLTMTEGPWLFETRKAVVYFRGATLLDFPVFGYYVVYQRGVGLFLLQQMVMLLITAPAAWLILKKQWHIKMGASQMAWFFTTMGLILFSIAAIQVGNNLTPEKIIDLSGKKRLVTQLTMHGNQGVAMSVGGQGGFAGMEHRKIHRINLDQTDTHPLGIGTDIDHRSYSTREQINLTAWSPENPQWAFVIYHQTKAPAKLGKPWKTKSISLASVHFPKNGEPKIVKQTDLEPLYESSTDTHSSLPSLYLKGHTLWVCKQQYRPRNMTNLMRFDVTDPASPVLVQKLDINGFWDSFWAATGGSTYLEGTIKTNNIDELSPEIQWELRQNIQSRFLDPFLATPDRVIQFETMYGLRVYERQQTSQYAGNTKTTYQTYRSEYWLKPTPLEKLIKAHRQDWLMAGDYLYVAIDSPQAGVVVYDVKDAKSVRKVGYFYTPGERNCTLVDMHDGRVALAGYKLHILNPKTW